MWRRIVDLPDPEPPMTTIVSPGMTWRFTPSRTTWSSNRLTRSHISTTGSVFKGLLRHAVADDRQAHCSKWNQNGGGGAWMDIVDVGHP